MQFQVPQFIETEPKIVGPLTLRQFLYIAAAGGLSFILFFSLQTWLWFIITSLLGTIAAVLAFVKYNGQPMHVIIVAAFKYLWHPRFYLWQEAKLKPKMPEVTVPEIKSPEIKTPEIEKPKVKTPLTEIKPEEIKAQEIKTEIKVPKIQTPTIKMPEIKIPAAESKELKMPKAEMPKAEMPEPKIPKPEIKEEIKAPTITPSETPPTDITSPISPTAPIAKPKLLQPSEIKQTTFTPVVQPKISERQPSFVEPTAGETKKPLLKNLWLKIQTGAQSLKVGMPASILQKMRRKDRYEIVRRLTGEIQKARRVDYR